MGQRPNLSVQGTKLSEQLVLISSPFGDQVKAAQLTDGHKVWLKKLSERVPFAVLALTDAVVVQGDQGTLWALRSEDGEEHWVRRTPDPLDYPMGPPRFREKAVFTVSRRGVIRKWVQTGESVQVIRDNAWGKRRAQTVPLRSNQERLTYLDQAGRLTTYEPQNLRLQAIHMLYESPARADVLAGAVTEDGGVAWVTELPGRLRAIRAETADTAWSLPLGPSESMWSARGELLAVPSMLLWDSEIAILVVTRDRGGIYRGRNGKSLASKVWPSEAVAPPAYDSKAQRWWILCREHVVSYDRENGWKEFPLQFVDEPFTMAVGEESLVVGAWDGRVYRLSSPFAVADEAKPKLPEKSSEGKQSLERFRAEWL